MNSQPPTGDTERRVETEQVWRALHADLFRFIRRRVESDDVADDLLQTVFLRIHQRIDSLRHAHRLRGWIFQIAGNAIIDHYRARLPAALEGSTPAEPEIDVESGDLNREVAGWLNRMIDQLKPEQRRAVHLSEIDGLTQRDVAERLGISVSGAKSRIQRGRRALKDALLACCHFEFDRRGNVIDVRRHAENDSACSSPCCPPDDGDTGARGC